MVLKGVGSAKKRGISGEGGLLRLWTCDDDDAKDDSCESTDLRRSCEIDNYPL